MLLELFYFPVVKTALSGVWCESVEGASHLRVLSAAPFLSCGAADVLLMRVVGVVLFLLYGLGFPGWLCWRLWRQRDLRAPSLADLQSLLEPFAPSAWTAPLWQFAQKALLAVLLTTISVNNIVLPVLLSLFLVSSAVFAVWRKEFASPLDNILLPAVLLAVCLVYLVRILHTVTDRQLFPGSAAFLSLGAVIMTNLTTGALALALVWFCFRVLRAWWTTRRARKSRFPQQLDVRASGLHESLLATQSMQKLGDR